MELARSRPYIQAPFSKLNIELYNESDSARKRCPFNVDGIALVSAAASESALLGDYNRFRSHAQSAMLQGVEEAALVFDWDASSFLEILNDIGSRETVCHYHLERLSKKDRKTGRRIDLYYDMTERESVLRAVVSDRNGNRLKEEVIAADYHPLPLHVVFPLRSTVLRDGHMIFRDRDGMSIATPFPYCEGCTTE